MKRGSGLLCCMLLVACAGPPKNPTFSGSDGGGGSDAGDEGLLECGGISCEQGTCVDSACVCNAGWTGAACDEDIVSCAAILAADDDAASGKYSIDPDGAGGVDAFAVYCDMTTDGGGWAKVLQYKSESYTPTAQASGDITTATVAGFAKLSDAQINALPGSNRVFRLTGNRSTAKLYVRVARTIPFVDTAMAWGWRTKQVMLCSGTSIGPCTFATATQITFNLDSLDAGSTNDCARLFTDWYNPVSPPSPLVPGCFPDSLGKRCVSAGMTCTPADAPDGHPIVKDFALWVREQ